MFFFTRSSLFVLWFLFLIYFISFVLSCTFGLFLASMLWLNSPPCSEVKCWVGCKTLLTHSLTHLLMMWTVGTQWPPGWFAVVYIENAKQKPKNTYKDNSSSCFDNLQHYNNYLTRHNACQHRLSPARLPVHGTTDGWNQNKRNVSILVQLFILWYYDHKTSEFHPTNRIIIKNYNKMTPKHQHMQEHENAIYSGDNV